MLSSDILNYLDQYGPLLVFVIMFLEALNLTVIPSYIILPAIGFFIEQSPFSFLFILVMTLLGSISGCLLYYIVARKFGRSMYNYFYQKFPLAKRGLDKASELSERYGAMMCFTGRIIPTVRVFISLMSGVFQIPFKTYLIYSAAGITVWNFITLFIGYLTALYS